MLQKEDFWFRASYKVQRTAVVRATPEVVSDGVSRAAWNESFLSQLKHWWMDIDMFHRGEILLRSLVW